MQQFCGDTIMIKAREKEEESLSFIGLTEGKRQSGNSIKQSFDDNSKGECSKEDQDFCLM